MCSVIGRVGRGEKGARFGFQIFWESTSLYVKEMVPHFQPLKDSTSVVHAKNDSVVHANVFSDIHT